MFRHWLRSLGVRYVLLPDAPLDYSSDARGAAAAHRRAPACVIVGSSPHWTFYALPHPTPIVTPPPGRRAELTYLGQQRVVLWTSGPGQLPGARALQPLPAADSPVGTCVRPAANGMTEVMAQQAGIVQLNIDTDPSPWRPARPTVRPRTRPPAARRVETPSSPSVRRDLPDRGMLPGPLDGRRTELTSIAENTASCALCRRHLLVGEPARLYQDPSSKRFLKVCPLCYEQADRRGWRADGRPIVAVHANPPARPRPARARGPDRPPARPAAVGRVRPRPGAKRARQGRAAGRRAARRSSAR